MQVQSSQTGGIGWQAHLEYAKRVSGQARAAKVVDAAAVKPVEHDEWQELLDHILDVRAPQPMACFEPPPHQQWDGWRPTSVLHMDLPGLWARAKGQLRSKPSDWDQVLASFRVMRGVARELLLFQEGRFAAMAA